MIPVQVVRYSGRRDFFVVRPKFSFWDRKKRNFAGHHFVSLKLSPIGEFIKKLFSWVPLV